MSNLISVSSSGMNFGSALAFAVLGCGMGMFIKKYAYGATVDINN